MTKEIQKLPGAKEAWVEGLAALPDPGLGKKLIIVVRASSVRLRVEKQPATIEEQEGEVGGAAK